MGWEVDGDGVVGGFMGWVGGWLEGSWGGCIYSPTHEVIMLKYLIL